MFYFPPSEKTLEKYSFAQNPNTPLETLKLLATDEYPGVRYYVAKNPSRTEIIERLVLMTNYQQNQ